MTPEIKANSHHLVLGEITDILTGELVADTYDERYKQQIASFLLDDKKFSKNQIISRKEHVVVAGDQKAKIFIDFLVRHRDKTIILIQYAPGSIVTRRLSTLALSRTIEDYQIPLLVVTNGIDAEIIDGYTGKVKSANIKQLPGIDEIKKEFDRYVFKPLSASVKEQAGRIVFACQINGACPCDSDVCLID